MLAIFKMSKLEGAEMFRAKMKSFVTKMISILELYDPELYPVNVLQQNEGKWTKLAQECYQEMLSVMLEAEDADWMTDIMKAEMIKVKEKCKKLVKEYVIKVSQKLAAPDPVNNESPAAADIDHNLSADTSQVNLAKVNAAIEFEKLTCEVKLLSAEIRKVEDWSAADSHVVEAAMNQVADWKEKLDKIKESYFIMKRNILTYDLPADDLLVAESKVKCLSSELDIFIDDLQFEDETRCLYSLSRANLAGVRYPTFSGSPDEDYVKFKNDLQI